MDKGKIEVAQTKRVSFNVIRQENKTKPPEQMGASKKSQFHTIKAKTQRQVVFIQPSLYI